MANMQERLEAAIVKTETDSGLLHSIVHGKETDSVTTDNGSVPSVAKAVKDIKDSINGQVTDLVGQAQTAATNAATSATAAATEVQNARAEVTNCKTEVNNCKAEVVNAKAEVTKAQTEVQNAKDQVDLAKAEVDKAKVEVQNAKAEVTNCQTEVNNAKAEVNNCKAEVVNAKAEVTNCQTEVNNAKAEVSKSKIWAEGTDAEVTAQGGQHSCQKWLQLVQQAAVGSFPMTVSGTASAGQTDLPLNLTAALTSVDQVLAVIIENTILLPENYTLASTGQAVHLLNPLAAGERWSVKCLYDMQSITGVMDAVIYEEMQGASA